MTTLAEKCKKVRKYRGYTQEKFAKIIGSSQAEISFVERGDIPRDKLVSEIEKEYDALSRWVWVDIKGYLPTAAVQEKEKR